MQPWVITCLIAYVGLTLLMEFVWDLVVNVSNKANIIILVHD